MDMYLVYQVTMVMVVFLSCQNADDVSLGAATNRIDNSGVDSYNETAIHSLVFALATSECPSYKMSGAVYKTGLEGTYYLLPSFTCNGRPVYRTYSSRLGQNVYLFNTYHVTGSRWYFSETQCGSTVYIRSVDTGNSRPNHVSTWEEALGGSVWEVTSVRITCSKNVQCYACSGYGSDCIATQYSAYSSTTNCDIDSGYYCWQSYTTPRYGVVTVKRECKYGCPYSNRYSYGCSSTCSSAVCSQCCESELCNKYSMAGKSSTVECKASARDEATWTRLLLLLGSTPMTLI